MIAAFRPRRSHNRRRESGDAHCHGVSCLRWVAHELLRCGEEHSVQPAVARPRNVSPVLAGRWAILVRSSRAGAVSRGSASVARR